MANLLIIEDNETLITHISEALKKEGYEVVTARTSHEFDYALQQRHTTYDAILADYYLRNDGIVETRGKDMLLAIRRIHPTIPVIGSCIYIAMWRRLGRTDLNLHPLSKEHHHGIFHWNTAATIAKLQELGIT